MIEEGQNAPEFSLHNAQNEETSLSSFRGQWVVLYFYPKDMTPGCTTEACDFTEFLPKMKNAVVLGVSPDSVESHQKFIQKHKLSVNLLADENKEIIKAYGAWGIKKNYGKEYEGLIRSTFLINPDGIVTKVWKNVRAKGHAKRVKETLDSLCS